VLVETHRARHADLRHPDRVAPARRRTRLLARCGGAMGRAAVPGRRSRPSAVRDVLVALGPLFRDDGPSARARAVLHQPGRTGSTPYDGRRTRAPRVLLL